jgi:hypothetical protein
MLKDSGFKDFVFREHRWMLRTAVGLLIIHFVLIKLLYPYANSAVDTWFYIRGADQDINVDLRPIGYSLFLRLVHFLTHDDLAVVALQYMLLEGAVLYFYFTLLYFLRPNKWIQWLILFCLIMNPLILCIGNYLISEAIFTALTVWWFTLMLWYCFRPSAIQVYTMVILLFLLFTLRYNSMFYPLITIPLVLFSRIGWRVKFFGLALGCVLFVGFIRYTATQYGKLTGLQEFSPFSGWQLAGNALLMYRHVPNRVEDIPPSYLEPLHRQVLQQMGSAAPPDSVPDRLLLIYYMWDARSPLQVYLYRQFPNIVYGPFPDDGGTDALRGWASMGKLYHDYGAWLIKKHPFAYLRYYVVQGIDWFAYPKLEISNIFDEGGFIVTARIQRWFGYPSQWVSCSTGSGYSFTAFPFIVTLLNLLLIIVTLGFYYCRCHKTVSPMFNWTLALNGVYWLLNFILMTTLAPMVLRYAIPIMIFNIALVPVTIERIYHSFIRVPKDSVAAFIRG